MKTAWTTICLWLYRQQPLFARVVRKLMEQSNKYEDAREFSVHLFLGIFGRIKEKRELKFPWLFSLLSQSDMLFHL
jgi:hypothetical protein